MRVGFVGLAVSFAVVAWCPAVAVGHDVVGTAAKHAAEDAVVHDAAKEAALARHTTAATAGDARVAAAAVVGDEHIVGSWGPLGDWPVVGVHVALMPNGKVLAYDSVGDRATETFTDHTFTRATVWDPATGTQSPVWVTGYNVFCSGLAHLPDGNLFLAGGNKNAQLEGIVKTHVFNYTTNTWSTGPDMAVGRWYPTVTPLRNGEMLITEGGPDIPEVRTTAGGLRSLNTASLNLPLYPWLDVAPDGRAFYSGPDGTLRALNTTGTGAWQTFGAREPGGGLDRNYGSHALYDIGKMLVAGGGSPSLKDARVIDINGATPQVGANVPMANGRRQFNLTVLADGTVLATGGNSSGASLVDLNNGVYVAELWNPATGTWRTLAAEQATRQYHSTALLLPDGRVLSAGGGICGTCDQVGYLAKNAQVFTPPYLFKTDGSGQLAPRPTIAAAPAAVAYGAGLQISTPDAAAIRKVALVRLGAVTHSVNMEQRYVPLTFTAGSGSLTATAPANANIAPPGVYMLFLVDAAGVPSVAKMVTVNSDVTPPSAPGGLTATAAASSRVDLGWTGSTDDVGVANYRVERCSGQGCTNFAEVATPTGASYSDAGLAAATTYRYRVRAADAAGNLSGYSGIAEATTAGGSPAPPGLVGAWGFSEGSGTTTADASGNGNAGTLTNATWSTQGRYGNAVSFNGTSSVVRVASATSLNLGSAMTLSAWVRPSVSPSGWRTIVQRQADAYLLTFSGEAAGRPAGGGTFGGNITMATGPTASPVNAWTHVAVTYDGATVRLYVNGTQAATSGAGGAIQSVTNPLWIGGNQPYGEYFQGLIDEVRVYNRAETAAEIQADMNTAITPSAPDTTPPSAPSTLTATAAGAGQINLSWPAASDNVAVSEYRVERCQGATCTNFVQVATPTATTFNNTGLAASTTYRYRVRAADQSGNTSGYSPVATATTTAAPDTAAPTAPGAPSTTSVSMTRIDLTWAPSTDNVGVTGYRVERCQGATCTNFAQVGTPTTTDYSSTGLAANTTYRFRVRAVDAAGNLSAYSSIATATTPADTSAPSTPSALTATAVGSAQVNLGWTGASDDVGVANYRVERCSGPGCTNFVEVARPTATSYSDTGLAASTTYRYQVRAADAAGNLSGYSGIAEATTGAGSPTPPGLVGAWAFGEGAGTTTADASGNGNVGTLTNATWSSQGRYGNALSFNGTNSLVRVASAASLNLGSAMTLSAWVRPSVSPSGWRTIVQRQADAYLLTFSGESAGRPAGGGTFGGNITMTTATTASPINAWTHVAATYDGATVRLYINGTQVATHAASGAIQSVTNPLWIGGNQPYGEYFQGLLDEVRVYNRSLTAAEIQTDMNTAITPPPGGALALRLPLL